MATDPTYNIFGNTPLSDTKNILGVGTPPSNPALGSIFDNSPLNDTRNMFNVAPAMNQTITSDSLAPVATAKFQQPNPVPVDMSHLLAAPTPTTATPQAGTTTPPPTVDTSYTPPTGASTAADPYALTAPEQNASDVIKRLQDLTTQYTGQSSFRTAQEEAVGIPALNTTESELTSRLDALKNEGLAIPMQLQQESIGRGITAGGLQPIQTAALRNNAIQSLLTQSQLASYQGKITLARAKVDAAVKQKFDPIKEKIDANTANLNLIINSPEYTNADKKRANDQLVDNKRKQQVLDFQKTNFETAQTMAAAAIKLNPNDQNALMAAQQVQKLNPEDPQYLNKVFQLLGQFQSDPAAVQKDIDAHLQANANLLKTNADIEAIKADTTLTPLKKQKMIADINATNANAEQSRASATKALAEAKAAKESGGLTPFQVISTRNQIEDNVRQNPAVAAYGQLVNFGVPTVLESFAKGQTDSISDTVLMRSLAKVTDPSTGVREEEYRTFEDAQGALNRLYKVPSAWVGKGKLTTTGRAAMIREITNRYKSRKEDYLNQYEYYKNQAADSGVTIPPPYAVSNDLQSQISAKGYDYQKMKADGYSDAEIKKAVGL